MDMTQSGTEDFDFNAEIASLVGSFTRAADKAEKRDSRFPDWNYPPQGVEGQIEAQWALNKETRAELDELEREEKHRLAVFQATCVEMEHKMFGGGRTPDRVKSVLAQHKQRILEAKVNALRMAKMAMCSHLFDTVITRARAITPKARQRGAVIRSTAKSGDSNSDNGGDPDPENVIIPDFGANKPEVVNYPDPTQYLRNVRKAVAAYMLLHTGPTTPREQRVAYYYIRQFTRYVRAYFNGPAFAVMGFSALNQQVPIVALDLLEKYSKSHDFDKQPNPNLQNNLRSNFRKPSDFAGRVRNAMLPTEKAKAGDLSVSDLLERGGIDTTKADLCERFISAYEQRENNALLYAEWEKMRAEAEETHVKVIRPIRSAAFRQREKDRNNIRHSSAGSSQYSAAFHVDAPEEGDLFDNLEAESSEYSTADADAVEAGNIARQLVQQVNHQTVSVDDVAKVILSQGEKGERVITALQKDLQNTKTCNRILTACGADLQSAQELEPEPEPELVPAKRKLDDMLMQLAESGVDDLLMQNAPFCFEYIKKRCGYAGTGNLTSALKTRVKNRSDLFDARLVQVSRILLENRKKGVAPCEGGVA